MSNLLTGRRRAGVAAALVVAVMLAVGCSSSGDESGSTTTSWSMPARGTAEVTNPEYAPQGNETETDYVDAFVAGYQARPDPTFAGIDMACVAPKWVAAIGLDAFFAAGVTPQRIATETSPLELLVGDEATAGAVVDAIPACGVTLVDVFINGLGVSDPNTVACIRRSVTEEQVRPGYIAAVLGSDGPDAAQLTAPCQG